MATFQSVVTTIEAVKLAYPMTIERPSGLVRGNPGDWLVSANGDQYFVDGNLFVTNYLEVAMVVDTTVQPTPVVP